MHQLDNLRVDDIGEVAEDHKDGEEADGGCGDSCAGDADDCALHLCRAHALHLTGPLVDAFWPGRQDGPWSSTATDRV